MELPGYEYDKGAQRNSYHCGCHNHMHDQRYDNGVKIEEQEPCVEKQSDSLVPLQLKNYPYPIMWIPPEYMKKYNEHGKPFESKVSSDQEIVPHNAKSHGNMRSSETEPRIWNGWSPLDINSLKSLLQGEDEKGL
ncbi:hypothetical protein Ddye_017649 [Dipteronia dyeriana]|uniref:Uncharacterized protein n=1 Tax=Dipteronia dyeriana TaxID=168575 RepID=A0AAD9X1L3_9ROSI|nr:hypothetical protein Ddye_017649 [Dipteronia dyeriana]